MPFTLEQSPKPTVQVLTEILTKMFMDKTRPDHISLNFDRLDNEDLSWINQFVEGGFKLKTLLVALSRVPGLVTE